MRSLRQNRYRVVVSSRAKRALFRLSEDYQKRVFKVLVELESDPYLGKPLKGELTGYYSVRVWPYRIIYQIDKVDQAVVVQLIKHRQGVYR